MSRIKIKMKMRPTAPVIVVADTTPSGDVGTIIETTFTVSRPGVTEIGGADAADFIFIGNDKVRLADSSVAGVYECALGHTDDRGRSATPVAITATVNAAAGLPAISDLEVTAVDHNTMQLAWTKDPAYDFFEAAIDQEYGSIFTPDVSDRLETNMSGFEISVQVRGGVTATGARGAWSNIDSVVMPEDPGEVEPGVTAVMADTRVRAIGMNVHFNFQSPSDSIWRPEYNAPLKAGMQDIGVRNWRTGFTPGATAESTNTINGLGALGIKFSLLMSPIANGSFNMTTHNNLMNTLRNHIDDPEYIHDFSGPNEVQNNLSGDYVTKTMNYISVAYPELKAEFPTKNVSVPTVWGRSPTVATELRNAGAGNYGDVNDFHFYSGGRYPDVGGIPNDEDENGDVNVDYPLATIISDTNLKVGAPTICSEHGIDALTPLVPGRGPTAVIMHETAQAAYNLAFLIEMVRHGVSEVYYYAYTNNETATFYGAVDRNKRLEYKRDENGIQQPALGLLTPAHTGPPYTLRNRLFYTALKRYIALLADPGIDFAPGALNYSFSGAGATGNLRHVLSQKRNTRFYIEVLHRGEKWNRATRALQDPRGIVNLSFGQTVSQAKVYNVLTSASPIATHTGVSGISNLSVPVEPLIIEIIL